MGLVHLPLPYVAMLVGSLASLLIAGVGRIGGEASLLFRLTNWISGEPLWAPEIVSGLLFGWFAYKYVPSKMAFCSFALPGVLLLWNVAYWQQRMSQYDGTWDTFFGAGCGGSECAYEFFLTAPFYTAVAYTVGAAISRVRGPRRLEAFPS